MDNGEYVTRAGSRLRLYGEIQGGCASLEFDWIEEGACIDCRPEPYPVGDELVWTCDYCGQGCARWFPVDATQKDSREG